MRKLSIAIDGPAGAGKSSVSKILASRLGYAYLDTGAMYRAVTYEALKKGLTDPAEITAMTKALDMEVKPGMDAMHVIVDGEDVTPFIRTPEVSGHVSACARRWSPSSAARPKRAALFLTAVTSGRLSCRRPM